MNITLFIFLLFSLQFCYWLVGYRTGKNLKNKDDYFLAGKSIRLFPLMMTFLATQVGGGVVLGAADEAYQYGWPVLFYPLGAVLGLIVLGMGMGHRLARFNVSTVSQIFEVVYQSTALKKIVAILSVISMFMILVAQIIASNKFLITLGFTNTPLFIVFWAIVILYTTQGGLKAVISTDVIQALFFSIVFLTCFVFVLLNPQAKDYATIQLPQIENFTNVSSKLCGWLLMPLLFMIIEQDMAQRCFAGASPRIVSQASLLAGISMLLVCIVPVFFGHLAKQINLEVPQGGSVLIAAIAKTTNPWMTALAGCAVLAAIISSATSLINAIGSNLSNDFKLSFLPQANVIPMIKVMTCFISIMAIAFAFYFDNIVDVLIQSYELSVVCLFIPLFIALFKKRGSFFAALFAMIFGAIGFILFRLYTIDFPKEVGGILLSLLGYGCGELITYTQANKVRCYETQK